MKLLIIFISHCIRQVNATIPPIAIKIIKISGKALLNGTLEKSNKFIILPNKMGIVSCPATVRRASNTVKKIHIL